MQSVIGPKSSIEGTLATSVGKDAWIATVAGKANLNKLNSHMKDVGLTVRVKDSKIAKLGAVVELVERK